MVDDAVAPPSVFPHIACIEKERSENDGEDRGINACKRYEIGRYHASPIRPKWSHPTEDREPSGRQSRFEASTVAKAGGARGSRESACGSAGTSVPAQPCVDADGGSNLAGPPKVGLDAEG